MPSEYKMVRWERFRKECEQFGLPLSQNLISEEAANSSNAQRIQLITSPEKLRK
jgi:hypothetical protein